MSSDLVSNSLGVKEPEILCWLFEFQFKLHVTLIPLSSFPLV